MILCSFFNIGTRLGRVVNAGPSRFTTGKETRYPLYRRLEGPIWAGVGNLAPAEIRFPYSDDDDDDDGSRGSLVGSGYLTDLVAAGSWIYSRQGQDTRSSSRRPDRFWGHPAY
jgi:hypothetical protein